MTIKRIELNVKVRIINLFPSNTCHMLPWIFDIFAKRNDFTQLVLSLGFICF